MVLAYQLILKFGTHSNYELASAGAQLSTSQEGGSIVTYSRNRNELSIYLLSIHNGFDEAWQCELVCPLMIQLKMISGSRITLYLL